MNCFGLKRIWCIVLLIAAFTGFATIATIATVFAVLFFSDPPPLGAALAKSDAIVLMAGDKTKRTPTAAYLYRNGYSDLIILTNDGVFSSWSTKYNRNLYEVEWTEESLVEMGVPRERIVKLQFYGSSTMNDALAVKMYAVKHGLKSLLLVTSDFHVERTLWSFRTAFAGEQIELAASPVMTGNSLRGRMREQVAILYYKFKFGLLKRFPPMNSPK